MGADFIKYRASMVPGTMIAATIIKRRAYF
jgi:hypothetical protein